MNTRNKIIAVVKFNDGEAYVLKNPPKLVYTKIKNQVIVGTDGIFSQCYFYDRPSKGWEAFAGREFDIALSDGTVEHCKGQWWDGVKPLALEFLGTESLCRVIYSTIDDLKRCYVFSGATGIPSEVEKMRKRYKGQVHGYWEYEKILNGKS